MFFIIVIFEWMTPLKIFICILCLGFLFSESAFGICIGCKIYHWIYKKSPHYCPGEVCQIRTKEAIQKISMSQIIILAATLMTISIITYMQFVITSYSIHYTKLYEWKIFDPLILEQWKKEKSEALAWEKQRWQLQERIK